MIDIAPELLQKIRKDFSENMRSDGLLQSLTSKIYGGAASYADAQDYAYRVGTALSDAFSANLTSAVLPDGRMYQNIAESILNPTMSEDFDIVAKAAAAVQQRMNTAAGIGLKAKMAKVDQDKIEGLIHRVADTQNFDDAAWLLDEPIKNFSQTVVDDTLKANVEFQGRSGLRPRIIRRAESKCCEWCSKLEGTYDYPDTPEDIYLRHERCRCIVEYDPGVGKRQNVHTKKWTSAEDSAKIENRMASANNASYQRQFESRDLLEKHYEKHVEEYGAISIPEYLERATALANEYPSSDVAQLVRSDGSTSKYRISTNDFVVVNKDGTIRTFFKPEKKEVYWQNELDRN